MEKRSLRNRKVSERMAVVDEADRRRVIQARLAALEEDNYKQDDFAAGSDDEEFELPPQDYDEEDGDGPSGGRKKKKVKVGGGMRKTRGMIAEKSKGPKTFRDYLEEAELERLPEGTPSYLTAAVGPPRTAAPRKFCSVCGDMSVYTCTRCGSRYCSRRCHAVHTETRCLKFMA